MQSLQRRHMKRLPALAKGDQIGVAAPASPFDPDRFFSGVEVLKAMGFQVVLQDDVFSRNGYLAGTDAQRLSLLHGLFADPAIKAIWCARGGYGAMRLLPHLDTTAIAMNPKPLIGSSDITSLLNFICAECGIVGFHAPMITTLSDADEKTLSSLKSALTGDRPLVFEAGFPETIVSGCATGPVAGGNLSTLSHLTGTPFFPDFSGAIVLLEDVGEKPYRIDRMLTQLLFSGGLDRAAGICLGSFQNCGEDDHVISVIKDRLSGLPIPVAAGFSFGHGMPNLTLPLGIEARLDAAQGTLSYLESALGCPDEERIFEEPGNRRNR